MLLMRMFLLLLLLLLSAVKTVTIARVVFVLFIIFVITQYNVVYIFELRYVHVIGIGLLATVQQQLIWLLHKAAPT